MPQKAEFTYFVRDKRLPVKIQEVIRQELGTVCREMKNYKTLRAAVESNIELFRHVFDACIQERMFPKVWKKQRLVLIPKDNNMQDASGYRCTLHS